MNTPNPLIPQGSLERTSKGKSTVRIAILTIVSIHAVFFAGLLMQGCRRDETKTSLKSTEATNQNSLAQLEGTTSSYYSATQEIAQATSPSAAATTASTQTPLNEAREFTQAPVPSTALAAEAISGEGKAYKVAKGDTLAKIAKANGVTVGAIAKANPKLEPSKLKVGQSIQIPAASTAASGIGFADPAKSEISSNANGASVHTVKAGETLIRIAKQHGLSVKAIRAANNLKTDRVLVGQRLKLPAQTSTASSESSKTPVVSRMSAANPALVNPTVAGTTVR